jgi:hypothetical protein
MLSDATLEGVVDGTITPADLHNTIMNSYAAFLTGAVLPPPMQQAAQIPLPQRVPPSHTSPEFQIGQLTYEPNRQWEYQICFALENCHASQIPDPVKLLTILNATRSTNPTVRNLVEQLLMTCALTQGDER